MYTYIYTNTPISKHGSEYHYHYFFFCVVESLSAVKYQDILQKQVAFFSGELSITDSVILI